jgi:hypothetical protein
MNNKYGRPLPCHLISTETAIEVEYWRFAVKNVVTKTHGFMTRLRVIKPNLSGQLVLLNNCGATCFSHLWPSSTSDRPTILFQNIRGKLPFHLGAKEAFVAWVASHASDAKPWGKQIEESGSGSSI